MHICLNDIFFYSSSLYFSICLSPSSKLIVTPYCKNSFFFRIFSVKLFINRIPINFTFLTTNHKHALHTPFLIWIHESVVSSKWLVFNYIPIYLLQEAEIKIRIIGFNRMFGGYARDLIRPFVLWHWQLMWKYK